MEYRIGHLAYATKDMTATLEFYSKALGFKHVFSIPDSEGRPWIEYIMGPGGIFIEFFYTTDPNRSFKDEGYMHLCLEVDDCAAAIEELTAMGANITSGPTRGSDDNIQAWIKDPDGRRIEIMQIVESSDQFKSRKAL